MLERLLDDMLVTPNQQLILTFKVHGHNVRKTNTAYCDGHTHILLEHDLQ